MGYWYTNTIEIAFPVNNWDQTILGFYKVTKDGIGDFAHAEGGTTIKIDFDPWVEEATISIKERSEDGGRKFDEDMLDWFNKSCEALNASFGSYKYKPDWCNAYYKASWPQKKDDGYYQAIKVEC